MCRHLFCVLGRVPVAFGPVSSPPQRVDVDVAAAARQPIALSPTTAAGAAPAFAQRLAAEGTRRVEVKRTPLSTAAAGEAIAQAYSELTGNVLSGSARSILTAQWAHETGHGASMFNFNFGGIKGVGPGGLSVAQRTREGFGSSERSIVDSFRAYGSVEEGAKDYVQLLLSRYRTAVSAAERGDASGFVHGLKDKGYFTGDPAAYERSIATIANSILSSSGEPQLASAEVPVAAAREVTPNANPMPTTSSPSSRRLGASLPEWQRTPTPMALLEVAGVYGQSGSSTDDIADLTAVRALQMSDEVTRAAIRIAFADGDGDGSRRGAGSASARR
jgi:hypothetical protein